MPSGFPVSTKPIFLRRFSFQPTAKTNNLSKVPVFQVSAITIDAAGTLIVPWPSVGAIYARALRGIGVDAEEEELEQRFRKSFAVAESSNERLKDSGQDFWKKVVYKTFEGICPEESLESIFQELWEAFAAGKCWRLAEYSMETCLQLKNKGYRLAILSNNDSRLRNVLQDLGVIDLFEEIFISYELGFEKPSSEIFRHVEKTMNTKPSDMLHVGDSLSRDVEGALSAGWSSVLFSKESCKLPEGAVRASSFPEISEMLP